MMRGLVLFHLSGLAPITDDHVVTLTLVIRGPDAPDAPALLKRRYAGGRVLLAEDNPVNRLVAEELLRSVGLVVESAGDGAQAVEMAHSRPYALILMDVHMPVIGGLDAARTIRAHGGPQVPIIAMTADDSPGDRAACLAAGMNDHVPKPVDPPALFATMLRWLAACASDRDQQRS